MSRPVSLSPGPSRQSKQKSPSEVSTGGEDVAVEARTRRRPLIEQSLSRTEFLQIRTEVETIRTLLQGNLEGIPLQEREWVQELIDIGCPETEIAQLLCDKTNGSSIRLETPKSTRPEVFVGRHLLGCPHSLIETVSKPLELSSFAASTNTEKSHGQPNEATTYIIEKLCGIGGSKTAGFNALFSTDPVQIRYTFGNKDFNSTHSISISQLHRTVGNLCKAIAKIQESNLCCDSFTILRKHSLAVGPDKVELCSVKIELITQLFSYLYHTLLPGAMSLSSSAGGAIEILSILCDLDMLDWLINVPDSFQSNIDGEIHLYSLTIQFLCLGLLSYNKAHTGPLTTSILDETLSEIALLGSADKDGSPYIQAELQALTCLHDMLQGPVLVFSLKRGPHSPAPPVSAKLACGLIGCPEDILDTWGPGCYVSTKDHLAQDEQLCAIRIGGGTIMASNGKERKYHWFPSATISPDPKATFGKCIKIQIGAGVEANDDCRYNEKIRLTFSEPFLENLGTVQSGWEIQQRQMALQGGNYVVVQLAQTWAKRPTRTLKQAELSRGYWPTFPFLQEFWGLQVSFCTGISQRVRLRVLIANVMLPWIQCQLSIPPEWDNLAAADIIEAFKNDKTDLQQWLTERTREQQHATIRIIQGILDDMKHTGIDSNGDFVVAWIRPEKGLKCFRIPCEGKTIWAKMLADSEDSATFAYINSE
ncbi:uncharacterized protein K452DRAFT_109119 [Aplosporella prunicola CBS 121167]|uniref:Uncharacterized protein n=1 Tax=Aplosporella prunicola CBS 121167 TaxID=1176127 RepID=A0A6A6BSW1_9PEZI|nr:uncharacterized protein K452DRAFT_109119 [Aplosporella prunicola CBS 121167]KAF2146334.1 hypothetical protein K452DRAFT_109119 [Aplosporella prunicola CBS 121167]